MFKTKRSLLSSSIALSLALLSTEALADTITVQAESFDNSGGTYQDGQPNPVTIYSVNGQSAINWVNAGDYVDFNITTQGGEYNIEYLVGTSVQSGSGIEVLVNNSGTWQSQGTVSVPVGQWDDFQSLTPSHTVNLPAGASTIRLMAVGSTWQWNMESFKLTQVTAIDGDADNDGVLDDIDQCPNTPEGRTVDANGCEVVSSGCSHVVNIAWATKTEVTLSTGTCIRFDRDLTGENNQFWDSDDNSSCNFRGTVSSIDGSGGVAVTGNYLSTKALTGTTLLIESNNACPYIKVKAY